MAPYNPPVAHYAHVNVYDYDENDIIMAMGQNGSEFKRLTSECNVKYVWWNKNNKVVEIWGNFEYMQNALEKIEQHLMMFKGVTQMNNC